MSDSFQQHHSECVTLGSFKVKSQTAASPKRTLQHWLRPKTSKQLGSSLQSGRNNAIVGELHKNQTDATVGCRDNPATETCLVSSSSPLQSQSTSRMWGGILASTACQASLRPRVPPL
jgi:hypothetical protein